MRFLLNLITAIVFITLCVFSMSASEKDSYFPIYDSLYDLEMPNNLRSPLWGTSKRENENIINKKGFENLRVSGSGQFSQKSFNVLLKVLPVPPKYLMVLDLREESHGLINGLPVAWIDHTQHYGNLNRSRSEIAEDENVRLKDALKIKNILISFQSDFEVVTVYSAEREKQLVEKSGATYIRIPTTSHHKPRAEFVDQFVEIVNRLKSHEWLHIHCQAGKGRTTIFLTLFDIMKNIHEVSLEDILNRQHFLGGSNLINVYKAPDDKERTEAAVERLQFVMDFARYCQEVPLFDVSWSEWSAANL